MALNKESPAVLIRTGSGSDRVTSDARRRRVDNYFQSFLATGETRSLSLPVLISLRATRVWNFCAKPSRINSGVRTGVVLLLTMFLLALPGCSDSKRNDRRAATQEQGASITADPNPIRVCDGSGVGVTKLSWTSVGPDKVEVRVASPDGDLFAQTTRTSSADTGKWVTDGMTFYLQDATGGKQLTAENTLAKVSVKVTSEGCQ